MNLTPQELKNTFARFVTGITVVTCAPDGEEYGPVGITVNSFTSVSLEPPLVLWCLDNQSSLSDHFASASYYAVNMLSGAQQHLSDKFSQQGRHSVDNTEYSIDKFGLPILSNCLANLSCKIVERYKAGDHTVLLGEVVSANYQSDTPLMYIGREYVQGPVINEE